MTKRLLIGARIFEHSLEVKKFVSSVFSLCFQAFSFILHLLLEVFPFLFYHALEIVDLCFEDSYEGFVSDLVENVGDRAFKLCLSRMSYSVSFRLI
jgi:hypothetical protein